MVRVGEIREAEVVSDQAWIEGTLADLRALMVRDDEGPDLVPSGLRIQILGLVSDHYLARSKQLVDSLWKAKFQQRVFAGLSLALLLVVGVGWYRFLYVEKIAQARAWRVQCERQHLAAKMGVLAAKGAFSWIMDRMREVETNPDVTPEEKALWKANLLTFGEKAKTLYEVAEQTEKKLANYTAPEEISKFTYVRDPISGSTLAFNATIDGSLDNKAVQDYMQSETFYRALVASAAAYSQKGAQPVPAFVFDPKDPKESK